MARNLDIKECELRAGVYLGDANEAEDRGQQARAEKLLRKAQYWLDRANDLSPDCRDPNA